MYLSESKIIEYYPHQIIPEKEKWQKSNLNALKQKKFKKSNSKHFQRYSIRNQSKTASYNIEEVPTKDYYKIFDEAIITVKSGNGGRGQIIDANTGKYVPNLKYHFGKNQPKMLWLPASDPADGADGGDVILYCDTSKDTLLEFHDKKEYSARNGASGNPEEGSQAPKKMKGSRRIKRKAHNLRIGVPPGTVVKRKGTGQYIGELVNSGDEIIIVKGGKGGLGATKPSRKKKKAINKKLYKSDTEVIEVEDDDWKSDTYGDPGKQLSIRLLLRIVADVGFVGFPNAGKSALLSCLTKANPEIAAYPFTTLIPNLGVMGSGGDPILVDLPGLIEGAHVGKGLGRNFLRHLRRTRVMMHVIDISSNDPIFDYLALREELRMYNPSYCLRPHIVALNKIDLITDDSFLEKIKNEIMLAAEKEKEKLKDASVPDKVILTSALEKIGILELKKAIEDLVKKDDENVNFEVITKTNEKKSSKLSTNWEYLK